jgi:hypothetical protein
MANQPADQKFAIVRTADDKLDAPGVARLLAEPLQLAVPDLLQVLPRRSGILAESLTEHVARQCLALLVNAGIAAQVVPQLSIVELPELVTLRSGRPDDQGFSYGASDQQGVVQWSEVLWVDFVSILESTTEEFDDWVLDYSTNEDRSPLRRFKNRRLVTKPTMFVDLVTYKPWLLMRIPSERFDFAATGLPMFPVARQNLTVIASEIASRAVDARIGPGLQALISRTKSPSVRPPSQAVYRGFLRWQLTLLFLAKPSE